MAGPGGVAAGRARVVVLPDLSLFGKSLKAYVERVERQVAIRIPTHVDTKGLEAELEKYKKSIPQQAPARVPVEPAQLDEFTRRLKAQVAKAAAATEAKIPATAQGEQFRRDLEAQVAALSKTLQVKVPVDLTEAAKFRADALAQVKAIEKFTAKVPVEPEVAAGFRARLKALIAGEQAQVPKLKTKVDVDRSSMSALTTVTGQLQTTAASVGAALATWGPALIAAGAAAVAVAPSVAVVAPAAVGAGLAVGTLALGLHGLGDAISASSDPKKFAAAMKGLSGSARDTVKTIVGLKPAFTNLRTSVQNALLKGIGPSIKQVATGLLPVLKSNMVAVATGFNAGAKSFAAFISKGQGLALIRANLAGTRSALAPLAGALKPLTTAFLQIGIAAAPAMRLVSQAVASTSVAFAGFIAKAAKAGTLQSTITGAVRAVGALLAGIGGVLAPLTKGLSAIGPTVLTGLGVGLKLIGTAISALVQNAPLLAPVFISIGRTLAPLGAAFLQLAVAAVPVFASIGQALAPLGAAFLQLAAAAVPIGQQVFASLASFGPVLSGVLAAVTSALIPIIAGFRTFLQIIGPQLGPTIQAIAGFLQGLMPTLQEFATQIGDKVGKGLAEVGQLIATDLLPAIQRILPVIQPVAVFLLNVLGGAVVGVLNGAINVIKGVIQVISGLLDFITGVFTGNWSLAWSGIQKIFFGLLDALKGAVEVIWNIGVIKVFKLGITAIKTLFTELGPALLRLGKGALEGLKSGATAGWSVAWTFIKSIPGLIVKGLGNLGSLLVSAGKNVVLGLINGIKGQARFVVAAAQELASHIPEPIRKFLHIASPSKVMIEIGRFTAEGLIKGLLGSSSDVAAAAQELAQKIADAMQQLADKRSSIAEKLTSDTAAVTTARAGYTAAVRTAGTAGAAALKTAQLRLTQAQAKLSRDQAKKASKGKAGLLATDQAAIARAKLAYKQAVAKAGTAAAKAVATARAKLTNAVAKLNADKGDMAELNASFLGLADAGTQGRIQKLIDATTGQLQDLADQREAVAQRLKDAQDQLVQAIQVRDDYARNLRDALIQFGNVTAAQQQAAGKITAGKIVKTLQAQLKAIVAYRANIEALRSGGLSDAALQQILAAGIDGGAATAAAIVQGGKDAIGAVNSLTDDIAQQAIGLGDEGARWFFQAGVDSAQALVTGLQAQQDALDAQAKQIADSLVAQIQKALGIAVDGNGNVAAGVMYSVGKSIGQQLADGISSSTGLVQQAASRLGQAAGGTAVTVGAGGALGRGTIGGSTVVNINNPVPEKGTTSITRAARTLALHTAPVGG